MNHDESLTLTQMVVTTWPQSKEWGIAEIQAFATGLQKYDAATMTHAIAAAQQKLMYRPSVAELREFYDLERAKRRAEAEPYVEQTPTRTPSRLPDWVKGWCVARYHYKDMRVWAEQDQYGLSASQISQEDRARYIQEGSSLTVDQVFSAIGVR